MDDCSWHQHINYIMQKARLRIHIMQKLKFELDHKSLETIYLVIIRPLLRYGGVTWDNSSQSTSITTGATKLVSFNTLYKEGGGRRQDHKIALFIRC